MSYSVTIQPDAAIELDDITAAAREMPHMTFAVTYRGAKLTVEFPKLTASFSELTASFSELTASFPLATAAF